jgi:hypothetical protein
MNSSKYVKLTILEESCIDLIESLHENKYLEDKGIMENLLSFLVRFHAIWGYCRNILIINTLSHCHGAFISTDINTATESLEGSLIILIFCKFFSSPPFNKHWVKRAFLLLFTFIISCRSSFSFINCSFA